MGFSEGATASIARTESPHRPTRPRVSLSPTENPASDSPCRTPTFFVWSVTRRPAILCFAATCRRTNHQQSDDDCGNDSPFLLEPWAAV
jgi:hypothetical protein